MVRADGEPHRASGETEDFEPGVRCAAALTTTEPVRDRPYSLTATQKNFIS
ncbi:hypothetical protein IQ268_14345 [Oculatella sp. LEGE 06141]|uniref:hypothetical protein n=1 Tax=Oculatella sp. LEGE 06141 TaxID=1828648 RepID=UPI0018827001|nr:hypothetical protein [Oculatella sp. LEGE 06141]MBE9179746.1 hypothetical protein [Oculatella sp. LEGE 06141]